MEKPTRREIFIFTAVALLVFSAWLCRALSFPHVGGSNPYRTTIYLALFTWWGFTLHRRLIHPQVRHFAVSIAVLLVAWFLIRSIKFSLPDGYPALTRYLWYLYYLPMLFVPTLAVFTALSIGLPEGRRLPKICNLLWLVPAVVFLLVFTNDLHQMVFTFPDNGMPWTDSDYSYAPGYYAYAVWVIGCDLATFVLLAMKSRRPHSRRLVLLPCVPAFLLVGYYLTMYILHVRVIRMWFGDMTAVSCVLYAASIELFIQCGLIRSNTGYREMFLVTALGAQIADRSNTVRLASADAAELTAQQIEDAETAPVFIEKNLRVRSKPIRFGHVLWQEDVSELTEAIEEYEENCRDLAENNRIRRENLEADRTLLALQEKNRAADLLQRETAGQVALVNSLLTRYEAETGEAERRRLLAGAAVVGSYIKRYGNLLLVRERNEAADIADLTRCFEESFINLELLGTECLCTLPDALTLKTEDMLRLYRSFEAVLEDCLPDLRHVWINGREQNGQVILNMEFVSGTDLSRHAPEADGFTGEAGTARFTFRVRKGGAEA